MKSQATAFAKWKKGVATGGPAYKDGIKTPKRDWATATSAAATRWGTGVQTAITNGHFARGVSKAGSAKWADGASGKGATRWVAAVSDATVQNNYNKGLGVLYGYLDTAHSHIASMPSDTPAERDARMLAFVNSVRSSAAAHKASS